MPQWCTRRSSGPVAAPWPFRDRRDEPHSSCSSVPISIPTGSTACGARRNGLRPHGGAPMTASGRSGLSTGILPSEPCVPARLSGRRRRRRRCRRHRAGFIPSTPPERRTRMNAVRQDMMERGLCTSPPLASGPASLRRMPRSKGAAESPPVAGLNRALIIADLRIAPMSLKKSVLEGGDITARVGRAASPSQAAMACGAFGRSLASFLRFCAAAARWNSSRAPFGPRSRSRSSLRMRFRWANSISTFFRCRREVT